MDPTLPVIVTGVAGGALIACALFWLSRRSAVRSMASAGGSGPERDVINISAIRVAGIGGLGLMAMAFGLAWTFPSVAQTLTLGAGLGLVLALALIVYRRRTGPMPSSAKSPAANTTLRLE